MAETPLEKIKTKETLKNVDKILKTVREENPEVQDHYEEQK